jgi:hypothetical protein
MLAPGLRLLSASVPRLGLLSPATAVSRQPSLTTPPVAARRRRRSSKNRRGHATCPRLSALIPAPASDERATFPATSRHSRMVNQTSRGCKPAAPRRSSLIIHRTSSTALALTDMGVIERQSRLTEPAGASPSSYGHVAVTGKKRNGRSHVLTLLPPDATFPTI